MAQRKQKSRHLSLGRRAQYGIVYLGCVSLVVGLLIAQSQGAFRDTMTVTTTMSSVGDGLPVGSDVKLRGVVVGRVARVDAAPGRHTVYLELKPDFQDSIPAEVKTRILPTNLFGAPFVDLNPVGAEQPSLADGAQVPEDRANGSVQLQTVFQKVYDVLIAVEPAKLNITLSAIADALDGNGGRIKGMIRRTDEYLAQLNPHAAEFQRDLELLATTLESVSTATPALLDTAENVAATAQVLVETRLELQQLMIAGIRAAGVVRGFVHDHGNRIIRFIDDLADVADVIAPAAGLIDDSLISLGRVAGRMTTIMPVGEPRGRFAVWLTDTDFGTYTAADCPRYPGLSGPNCGSARLAPAGEPTLTTTEDDGGPVGPVGSPEEDELLGQLLATDGDAAVGDLGSLLLGPVLRGSVVSRR